MVIIEIVITLLKNYALCDNCLGRQFAMLGHGLTNEERGSALKLTCVIEGHRLLGEDSEKGSEVLMSIASQGSHSVSAETLKVSGFKIERQDAECQICGGAFKKIDKLAKQAIDKLLEYEYESFLVGIKSDVKAEETEDELRARFRIKWGESIRNEFSREIGKKIMQMTKKKVDLRRPDILVVINPFTEMISLEVNSIFISGRYCKLVRGISQSRWICSKCDGRGCQACGWNGKLYDDSVEELIANPLLKVTGGRTVKLHAAGREDVDVRMLGSGRPFVAEVKRPKQRKIDLEKLRRSINLEAKGKIEVNALNFSSKEYVRQLKEQEGAVKVYRAIVEFERELGEEDLAKIVGLENELILQQTPLRVVHRRAIKKRKKYLYGITLKKLQLNLVEILIRCQGGLYIKELINGDEGRTTPSVSGVVAADAKCIELDVMEVEF